MTTVGLEAMVSSMEKLLGMGEPNKIQDWFRQRDGAAYAGNFPWCDAAITWAAVDSGNYNEVCFGIDFAYTVAHAARFQAAGEWTPMVNGIAGSGIRRGDIVFFDWAGSSSIAAIDHVGIVTGVSGDTVLTVEGNTANVCARRARVVHDIAGFGRPKYKTPPTVKPSVSLAHVVYAARHDPAAAQGHTTYRSEVLLVERALQAEGLLSAQWVDGSFGTKTVSAYAALQRRYGYTGSDADGIPGHTSLTRLGDKHGFQVVA